MHASPFTNFPGWILLGQYPLGDPDGVGSWILHEGREAALLELPPDEELVRHAVAAVHRLDLTVKFITVSHDHEDHFDPSILRRLKEERVFRDAKWLKPEPDHVGTRKLDLNGESLWLVDAPKHSRTDRVVVFRGIAMTGDIELGLLRSVNREVKVKTKRENLAFLAAFQRKAGYRIHTIISAHLNDFRVGIDWESAILGPKAG
jgi:hydroxyacylglutathione hydrolase